MEQSDAGRAATGTAFGAPGLPPRWSRGDKDGIGTAYSADSRVWFTLWRGIVTEVYFPTVDRPQTRDLQFLVTDGETFFHEEKRHLIPAVRRLDRDALGFRVRSSDPDGRYVLDKEVIASPHLPAVLLRARLRTSRSWKGRLRAYLLCAPHLEGGGAGNSASVTDLAGRRVLVAEKGGSALALAASVPFRRTSCGYVGRSDGWTDLAENYRMDWAFDAAPDGNVALTGELDRDGEAPFTVALALGRGLPHATTTLLQALATPYEAARKRFVEQWRRACHHLAPLASHSGDRGRLYHASVSTLLAHEDKNYAGGFVASLAIPWGSARGDAARGGYHLVWTRDLVHIATGLLAAGNHEAALRALVYLASRQRPDGGFPQNFWVTGEPYWNGLQLDEVAHPILLAGRLHREHALGDFDPYPMVRLAAGFLVHQGPVSLQDRWEEVAGYSPSTLAVQIAALFVASEMAREHGDATAARFLLDHADYLEAHLEEWTVSTTPEAGGSPHFVRVQPPASDGSAGPPAGDPSVTLPNQPPGTSARFPASGVIDAGFLELVRYGVRSASDPLVVGSLQLVDRLLKVDTPVGPVWRRYNHDGYGEHPDGGPYDGWGQGRAWPLLTGERAHYELAAGRDTRALVRTLEQLASAGEVLPEQVWDEADRPERHLALGRPTGSAMPLAWAHAEYVTLLRSVADGTPFGRIPALADRYARAGRSRGSVEVWKTDHRAPAIAAGRVLRVLAAEPFRLRWSRDDWATVDETPSAPALPGVEFVDLAASRSERGTLAFTFHWLAPDRWEGRDYVVRVLPLVSGSRSEPDGPSRPTG